VRRRTSTRWGLAAAVAALAALVVSPLANTANFTITPGGPPVTVTVASAGTTSTATFTTTVPNQRVSLYFSGSTITSTKVSILKPGSTNLVTPFTVTRAAYFWDVHTLPLVGTYKIVIDPKYDYTGRVTLTLYDVPPDPTAGPIALDGSVNAVTTTTPGQNGYFTFDGVEGHRVSVGLTGVTYSSAKLRIRNPDNTLLYPTALAFGPGGGFLEPKLLGQTGRYTIEVDPQLRAVGQASLQLYDVTADSNLGPAALDGTNTNVATSSPGQNAYLSFTTTVPNQRVSFLFQNSTYDSLRASVLTPGATPLYSPSTIVTAADAFVDVKTLATVGTYKVLVDPQGAATGNVDVKIYNVPADVTGSLATNGTQTTIATGTPGRNAVYTFSGNAGQRVSLDVVEGTSTYDSAKVTILKPDGTALGTALTVFPGLEAFQSPVVLPVTSTAYKVKVDPQGPSTGQLDVKLFIVAPDVTGALTPGVAKVVNITSGGQNALLTYAGTAGQRISFNLTGSTLESAKFKVTKPNGATLVLSTSFSTSGLFVDAKSVDITGSYKISIDPQIAATGSVTVTLYLVNPEASSSAPALTSGGVAASVTTVNPGQNGRINFSAAAGQNRLAFKLLTFAPGFCPVKIGVQRVSDSSWVSGFHSICAQEGDWFDTETLPSAPGSYRIVVDPQGSLTGTASFTVYAVPPDVTGTLTTSAAPVLSPGQNARYQFAGASGKTASVTPASSGTIDLVEAKILDTNGTTSLDTQFWNTTGGTAAAAPVGVGTYFFTFDPVGDASGSLSFTLALS
jgi:hypothetical protein